MRTALATVGTKTGRATSSPPFRFEGRMAATGEEGAAVSVRAGGGKGRRKQINTGEQEGPANERTDAKSSADQRRDALQSSLLHCVLSVVSSSLVDDLTC